MPFKALHELVQSICPASLPNILLSTLSLALWAYVISFLSCWSSGHRHMLVQSCPHLIHFPGLLVSAQTSLVRSYFSYFCVFLFIISLPPLSANSVRVWTCPICHCHILYTYKSIPLRRSCQHTCADWMGRGRKASSVRAGVFLSAPCH